MDQNQNRRILIIDDNQAIHDDFRKILGNGDNGANGMAEAETAMFGFTPLTGPVTAHFEIESAFQGVAGLACVEHALAAGRPYAMAFIDVRMPPGWDGIETTERIWKVDPELQIVICTAYSDYSWSDAIAKVGQSDRLVILKKPFDNIEALQLALALTNKWHLSRQARRKVNELGERVRESTIELTAINTSLRVEVAERKQAEEALRESREHYRNLVESQGEGVVITDLNRRFTFANPAAETILGAWPGQLVGKTLDEFVDEKNQAVIQEQFKLRQAGKKTSYEIEITAAQGERRQILITGTPQTDAEGRFSGTFAVFRDITLRKKAEQALRENQRLLKAILDNIPDPAWLKDPQGRYLLGNKSLARIYRRGSEEIVGKTVFDVFPEHAEQLTTGDAKVALSGKPTRTENCIPDAEGHNRWFDTIETPIFNEQGEITGQAGIARDVTERKEMEATLRESEARYRSLFENMLEGFACCRMIFDQDRPQDFVYLEVNAAFEKLTGLKNVIGKTATEVIPGIRKTNPELFEIYGRVALSGKPEKFETFVDGLKIWFSIAVYSYQTGHFIAIFENITERRQTESRLRESEERFRGLLEGSHDAIMLLAPPDWKFTYGNPAALEMFRANNLETLMAFDPWKLSPERQPDGKASADRAREMIETAVREGSHLFEWTHRRINGEEFQADVLLARMERDGKITLQATVRDITRRKQMEEDLRQKTARLEALVNSSPDGILVVNEQGEKILQNPQFNELLKIPRQIAEQSDDVAQLQYVVNSTKHPEQFKEKVLHLYAHPDETSRDEIEFKDGRILERYSAPVLDQNGSSHGRIWMFRDITERKRAEEKLHLQSSALAATANGIAITDRAGIILWVNPAFTRLTGYDSSEVVGKTPQVLKSGVHERAFYQNLWDTILTGKGWQGEVVNRRKDGSLYHEEMTITPVLDEKGAILNFVAVKQDVSERKEIERTLALERDLLQELMDNMPDFIYFKDTESRFKRVNLSYARQLGLQNPVEAIGRKDADLFPSSRFPRQSLVEEQRLIASGVPLLNQVEEIQAHTGVLWVSTTKIPLRDRNGKITGLVGISRDITGLKSAENALAETSYMLETLLENSPDAIYFKDLESRFVRCSNAFLRLFQVSDVKELVGKSDFDFFSKEHAQPAYEDEQQIIRSGKPIIGKLEREDHPDGRVTWALTTKMPWRDQKGRIVGTYGVSKDVTGLKEAERDRQMMEVQLRQAQKLESIGQLAAGIAHEINTPTQYVGDNTRFLKDAFANIMSLLHTHGELLAAARQNALTPELLERTEKALAAADVDYICQQIPPAIQETLEGVERIAKIVRAMKEFSHPGSKEKSAADLNKAIESTTTVARNEWKYVSDLTLDLAPDLPLVPCFVGEFNQAILNLVVNAAHAIGDVVKTNPGTKGLITIRTRRDGDHVEVRVSDTGTGIAEANRSHIFEPFFTTKEVGRGTGQGLNLVYSTVVKKHGGTATFETEVGKGTTFVLRFPIHTNNPEVEKQPTGETAKNQPNA